VWKLHLQFGAAQLQADVSRFVSIVTIESNLASVEYARITHAQNCHSDRSGPIFSSAPNYGASGRGVEESLLNCKSQGES
jgi:hypothetical protein